MISRNKPFLGGSPDNITHCKCTPPCKSIVVEYKCPWSHKNLDPKEAFLQPEIGGMWENNTFSLKQNSRYYHQIQVLMYVTELQECDLVVWTCKGIFCSSTKLFLPKPKTEYLKKSFSYRGANCGIAFQKKQEINILLLHLIHTLLPGQLIN